MSTTFSSFINNNNIDPKAQKENNLGFLKIIIIFRLNHVPEMLSCITSVCIFEASSPPPKKKKLSMVSRHEGCAVCTWGRGLPTPSSIGTPRREMGWAVDSGKCVKWAMDIGQ